MIRLVCTSCQKPLSIDETKLPMKEVSFPCPACKAKVKVDRRKLASPGEPAAEPAAPPIPGEEEESYGEKALLVGSDTQVLRSALASIGFQPVPMAAAEQARDLFLQEYPKVVLISPPQITPPPLESMQALLSVMPVDRRRGFFILVADNLRTLDGNAAFLYGVNLVVAARDLPSFPRVYKDALAYHNRLYASMHAVQKLIQATA